MCKGEFSQIILFLLIRLEAKPALSYQQTLAKSEYLILTKDECLALW